MTVLHATNAYNIQATMNKWWSDQLNALTKPTLLPAYGLVFNRPETKIAPPCFSFDHLPVSTRKKWQGDQVGGTRGARAAHSLDISCWVSRGASVGAYRNVWSAQLMLMQAMVEQVLAGGSTIQVYDYTTSPSAPSAVLYKIDLRDGEWVPVQRDPNPDLERARFLVRYEWTVRS